MKNKRGIILKCIGGFYYVNSTDDKIYECKARGIFRKTDIKPVAGDKVEITIPENGFATIDKVFERKNILVRPPIANIDRMFIVSSVLEPKASTLVIDQLVAISELLSIEPVVIFSKSDLGEAGHLTSIYSRAGIKTYLVSKTDEDSIVGLKKLLAGNISAFVGNSGVGKSTLINFLFPQFSLSTGEISQKLGRGRHTTRQVELFKLCDGYIADTPGFSSIDLLKCVDVSKENLVLGFVEFNKYTDDCKFSSCSHTNELGCAVIDAVNRGEIDESRHKNYVSMYRKLKEMKVWK